MRFDPLVIPEHVRLIHKHLSEAGFNSWVVGGCVRDTLRGAKVSDWDLTTNATPDQVTTLFKLRTVGDHLCSVIPIGNEHGTVAVAMQDQLYELTTLRGDGVYSDGRRPDSVHFVSTIEEDLARRDFTVNAMAANPVTGEIVDPWGGLHDMEHRILKAVGDPNVRFQEDGLRVLRAARFASVLQFELDKATEEAIRPNLETFRKVARERILAEWFKTIEKAAKPALTFRIMRRTGILDIVAPFLATLSEAEFDRAMERLDNAPKNFRAAMACLLLETPETSQAIDKWLREMKVSNQDREAIVHLTHSVRMAPLWNHWRQYELRQWASNVGRRNLSEALEIYFSTPFADKEVLTPLRDFWAYELGPETPLELKDLDVTGTELQAQLGIPPSKKLGDTLKALLEVVLKDPASNKKEILLSHARTLL